jgi:hypothetical protein
VKEAEHDAVREQAAKEAKAEYAAAIEVQEAKAAAASEEASTAKGVSYTHGCTSNGMT